MQMMARQIHAEVAVTGYGDFAHREVYAAAPVTGRLHMGVYGITIALYVLMVATFFVGFGGSHDLLVPFGVITGFGLAFVGVPLFMARAGGELGVRAGSLTQFARGNFDTFTGIVSGRDALTLILTIPVCLTAAAAGMAIVLHVLR